MEKIHDLRIQNIIPLISPEDLKKELQATKETEKAVINARNTIEKILHKQDKRLFVIAGPCSIHDEKATMEYAEKLNSLRKEVEDNIFLIMRVYFEKPRTTIGWKGLINDPFMDGSHNIEEGMKKARGLLLEINAMGLPAGTEFLDPITPQYIADLISWAAVGARTSESQIHREMASGLSMAIGFKNSTDGSLTAALNSLEAARTKQSFLGIDQKGYTSIFNTKGNPLGHIVLRGGSRPNYDPVSIDETISSLRERKLPEAIVIDCSHANSGKKHQGQSFVWKSVIEQRLEGNSAIVGMMLESNLFEGNQKLTPDLSELKYGVSITDECISWETTEELIRYARKKMVS